MKNKKLNILIKKQITFVALWCVSAIAAAAQPENFRVGETVETNDGRVCRILAITGRSARVACGANRSDIRVYGFDSMTSEARAAARREQEERQRQNAANQPRQPTTVTFRVGDAVQTPDRRAGEIESFKPMSDLAKVQFADGSTQYFNLSDLKKAVDPSKPTFRVGDTVVSPRAPAPGVIESINGVGARIRFGRGKYDYVDDLLENLMTSQQAAEAKEAEQQEKLQKPLRAQFMDEAQAFSGTIFQLAPVFDSKYYGGGTGITQENKTYEAWRKDLESLDAVCRKFPNMTNPVLASYYQQDVKMFPADWCKMAAQRTELLQKTKKTVGNSLAQADVNGLRIDVERALNDEEGYINAEIQKFIYDRAAWERAALPAMQKHYLEPIAAIPAEVLKPLEEKAAALKAKIESEAPTRAWTQPKYTDVALEAVIRRQSLTDFPGAKVFKTGMDYTTWVARDDKSFVGSDSYFKYYRITPGAYRFKRGKALVKLPNQPFCQIKEFQLTQHKAGAGYGAAKPTISGGGVFVKCS